MKIANYQLYVEAQLSEVTKRMPWIVPPKLKGITSLPGRIEWFCTQCDQPFERTVSQVLNSAGGRGCPKCGKAHQIEATKAHKQRQSEENTGRLVKALKKKNPRIKILTPLGRRTSQRGDLKFKCLDCKQTFSAALGRVVRRLATGCPRCGTEQALAKSLATRATAIKQTRKVLVSQVRERLLDFPNLHLVRIKVDPANQRVKVDLTCSCGRTWEAWPSAVLGYQRLGCQVCSIRSIKDEGFDLAYQKNLLKTYSRVKIIGTPTNLRDTVTFSCLECQGSFEGTLSQGSHNLRCPTCHPGRRKGRSEGCRRQKYFYTLEGKRFSVEGYEQAALKWLVEEKGLSANEILQPKVKNKKQGIPYLFLGKEHYHYPDFFIPHHNLIVEVKSVYTGGLMEITRWRRHPEILPELIKFDILRAKAKAAVAKGYKYRVLLPIRPRPNREGFMVVLPHKFYLMKKSDVVASVLRQYPALLR